jgi:acyl-CoA thioesterase I
MNKIFLFLLPFLLISCGSSDTPMVSESTQTGKVILAIGDSLTAGLGLPPDQAYPAQLEAKLQSLGYNYTVQNA